MFAFRLALALGMTVAELGRRMSAAEFAEWQAYSQIEPFGARRADQRAWLGVMALANVHRGEKAKPIDLLDVLPEWRAPVDENAGWADFLNLMDRLEKQHGNSR